MIIAVTRIRNVERHVGTIPANMTQVTHGALLSTRVATDHD